MEQIQELRNRIDSLKETDVSHNELGSAQGFAEVQESHERRLDLFASLLDRAETHAPRLNPVVLAEGLTQISAALTRIEQNIQHVEQLVPQVNTPKYPNDRQQWIQAAEKQTDGLVKSLVNFESALRIAELEATISAGGVGEAVRTFKEEAEALRRLKADANQTIDALSSGAMEKGVSDSQHDFAELASAHGFTSRVWFIAFCVSAVGAAVALYYIFKPVDIAAIQTAVPGVSVDAALALGYIKRFLLLSFLGVAMRITMAKYNLERNLQIVYRHRQASLQLYTYFEKAIGDGAESRAAKNQFRLEIAKYVFSDPATGYIAPEAAREVAISPVFNVAEKALSSPGS